MWKAAKALNFFLVGTIFGVCAVAFSVNVYTDPVKNELAYFWSRIANHSAWEMYDNASLTLNKAPETLDNIDDRKRIQNAINQLRSSAEANLPQAMLEYGEYLCTGWAGVLDRSPGIGRAWIHRAALAGHPRAALVACDTFCMP